MDGFRLKVQDLFSAMLCLSLILLPFKELFLINI